MKKTGLGLAGDAQRGAAKAGGRTIREDVLATVGVICGLTAVTFLVDLLVTQMFR